MVLKLLLKRVVCWPWLNVVRDFNPNGGSWEWFMLAPDLSSILGQGGADIMDGMCNVCHIKATGENGMDYVFKHPNAPFNN